MVRSSQEHPLRGHNLQLIDMDGNIVRVMKGLGGIGFLSTSLDDKVCVTDMFSGSANVIDLASGEVLLHCPKPKPEGLGPFFFGFGRAVPSGKYKVVRLRLERGCEILTIAGHNHNGRRWAEAKLPPTDVSFGRCSPVVVNGVMYFWIGRAHV